MKYLPGGRHFQLHTREEQNFRLFVAASPHVVSKLGPSQAIFGFTFMILIWCFRYVGTGPSITKLTRLLLASPPVSNQISRVMGLPVQSQSQLNVTRVDWTVATREIG